jgi:hypothetical protein
MGRADVEDFCCFIKAFGGLEYRLLVRNGAPEDDG